ncbi:MAG: hypothetical protein D6758_01920 [Gammaproteobacteria bacterium]|nr:MAG: hypothetical protein D6758_01920 [Gammaproteobacteria bacterium]
MIRETNLLPMRTLLIACTAALWLTGCATYSQPPLAGHPSLPVRSLLTPEEMAPAPEEQSPHPTAFSRDVLARLLTAEFAAQHEDYATLLRYYREVAEETHDSEVIVRAVRIAQFVKDEEALTSLALLWAQNEPGSIEARQLAAFQLIKAQKYEDAVAQMEAIMDLGGASRFDRLALHARNLEPEDQKRLEELYRQLHERHPDAHEVTLGYAMLLELTNQPERALALTRELVRSEKAASHEQLQTLHARLLDAVEGTEASLAYLADMTRRYPDNLMLGSQYARTLIKAERLDDAMAEYERLLSLNPDASHLKLSHALVALQAEKFDVAREELQSLVQTNAHKNEALFFLGRLADMEKNTDEAIRYYLSVRQGGRFFNALGRAGYLLVENGREDEAIAAFNSARNQYPDQASQLWDIQINIWLRLNRLEKALEFAEQAIEDNPDDIQLRYARAMLNDRLGNYEALEADLRYILEVEPDNAVALNALGYSYANRNIRLLEAYDLITRALELDPDNAPAMDSMGWVKYRLGETDEALKWIERAWAKMKDPEIAAHLGELLWLKGDTERARQIWQEGLSLEADHPVIMETLHRLGAELPQ